MNSPDQQRIRDLEHKLREAISKKVDQSDADARRESAARFAAEKETMKLREELATEKQRTLDLEQQVRLATSQANEASNAETRLRSLVTQADADAKSEATARIAAQQEFQRLNEEFSALQQDSRDWEQKLRVAIAQASDAAEAEARLRNTVAQSDAEARREATARNAAESELRRMNEEFGALRGSGDERVTALTEELQEQRARANRAEAERDEALVELGGAFSRARPAQDGRGPETMGEGEGFGPGRGPFNGMSGMGEPDRQFRPSRPDSRGRWPN
jgi:hypothetical protein